MDGTLIKWNFVGGRSLMRRLPMEPDAALRYAESNAQREIFRRAGLAIRSMSEHDYLDTFPRVKSIEAI